MVETVKSTGSTQGEALSHMIDIVKAAKAE